MRPPPFVDLRFLAELENTEPRPLWFLFPLYMSGPAEFGRFLASAVEVSEPPGRGRVRIARFLGDGSFQALRLPPGARVRIHDFPLTMIGEPPRGEVAVPVMLAETLQIGDQRAEDWFQLDVSSEREAEVTDEPGSIVASQDTQGARAVPVTASGARTLTVRVAVDRS
jgi:hypothetical protein